MQPTTHARAKIETTATASNSQTIVPVVVVVVTEGVAVVTEVVAVVTEVAINHPVINPPCKHE